LNCVELSAIASAIRRDLAFPGKRLFISVGDCLWRGRRRWLPIFPKRSAVVLINSFPLQALFKSPEATLCKVSTTGQRGVLESRSFAGTETVEAHFAFCIVRCRLFAKFITG
jgi:hypothetical protein